MAGTNIEAKIKERAYQIWEREGRPHGKHLEHWRRAEQEVKSQADQNTLQRSVEPSSPMPRMSPSSPAAAPSAPAGAAGETKRAKPKATAKTKAKAEQKSKSATRKPRSGTSKPTV